MRREDVFEVLEPPPFGLVRLRARMRERRSLLRRRALVVAVSMVAALVVARWRRPASLPLTVPPLMADVASLDPTTTAIEPLSSRNVQVVLVRVLSLEGDPRSAR